MQPPGTYRPPRPAPWPAEPGLAPMGGVPAGQAPGPRGPAPDSPLDSRWWDVAFIAAAVAVFGLLLWLGRGNTFFADSWAFITNADTRDLDALMRPYNGHWVALPRLIYWGLLDTIGISTYVPYLAILLGLHVLTAAALYVYGRRVTMAFIAFVVALVFLLLGSTADGLFMAFQISWNGAAAAGAWALVILLSGPPARHVWLAAVLLVVTVAMIGNGLAFLAAAAAVAVFSAERRRLIWAVVPAGLAYLAWYLVWGSDALGTISEHADIIAFVAIGVGHAVGAATGMGSDVGLVIGVLLVLGSVANLVVGEPYRPGLVAGTAGLVGLYLLSGVVRAEISPLAGMAPRYVHTAAAFFAIALLGALAFRNVDRPGQRIRLVTAVAGLAAVALAWNVGQVREWQGWFADRAADTRAAIYLLTTYGGTPAIPLDQGIGITPETAELVLAEPGIPPLLPGATELEALLAKFGSPLDDPLAEWEPGTRPEVTDAIFANLVRDAIEVDFTEAAPLPLRLRLDDASELEPVWDGRCAVVSADPSGAGYLFDVDSGSGLHISTEVFGAGELFVTLSGSPGTKGVAHGADPELAALIRLPDIGDGQTLKVRYLPAEGGSTTVCAVP